MALFIFFCGDIVIYQTIVCIAFHYFYRFLLIVIFLLLDILLFRFRDWVLCDCLCCVLSASHVPAYPDRSLRGYFDSESIRQCVPDLSPRFSLLPAFIARLVNLSKGLSSNLLMSSVVSSSYFSLTGSAACFYNCIVTLLLGSLPSALLPSSDCCLHVCT